MFQAVVLIGCVFTVAVAQDGQQTPRAQRWTVFGEPYQQRYMSVLPGSQQSPFLPGIQQSPWPPIPSYPTPSWSEQPLSSPVMYAAPQIVAGPQESSSRDLDVGVYTGMDMPYTQLPPFSRIQPQTGRWSLPLLEQTSRDMGVNTGDEVVPHGNTWAPLTSPLAPYPWLRQQGGFALKPSDNDVKLTMHVPKDGVPGGVLVMEMKASVYRPVY